jgi:RimJ/RimL family protein N-acetyltransferase
MTTALPRTLRTPRLVAERLEERHIDDLERLYAEPAVADWLGGVAGRDEVLEWLETTVRPHWEWYGFGLFALYTSSRPERRSLDVALGRPPGSAPETPVFVGRAGLMLAAEDVRDALGEPQAVELLYALMPGQWGRGYATEIGRALAGLGLGQLGLGSLIAYTLPDNVRSRSVLEKCDFVEEREVAHEGMPHVLYRRRSPVR